MNIFSILNRCSSVGCNMHTFHWAVLRSILCKWARGPHWSPPLHYWTKCFYCHSNLGPLKRAQPPFPPPCIRCIRVLTLSVRRSSPRKCSRLPFLPASRPNTLVLCCVCHQSTRHTAPYPPVAPGFFSPTSQLLSAFSHNFSWLLFLPPPSHSVYGDNSSPFLATLASWQSRSWTVSNAQHIVQGVALYGV